MYYIYGGWSFFFIGILWSSLILFFSSSFIVSFDWGSIWSVESWDMLFFFDFMGCSFLAVLSFIVSGVYFFSYYYMQVEVNNFRFFWVVFLFVLSMYVLIVSPNLLFFLLGWDGLGFTSFLLVAWFGCFSSRSASLKTYLINRFGDALFLLAIAFLLFQGHFNIFSMDFYVSWFIPLFLVLGSFTKSAQFPFSSWLPAAMAAPTPVSSLVHSSTLVTAGIYFLIRFSPILSSGIMLFVGVIGIFTMFFASLCAVLESDVKKIVAFSTLSQLGFMCFCVSVGLVSFSFFYLLIHACFKALMFISVGIFMLCGEHSQDIRNINGVWYFSPLVFLNLFVSVTSLSGFPFLSGFVLKDLIIYSLDCGIMNIFCSFLFTFSVIFTSLYSFRLFFLIT
uniref:NADH:ubiquinone reductase (H(+)-translocating) n=1 Tax=Bdellocephala punctata TaxID=2755129 RepID=A0A7D6W564_9PLAT|nr:NADH dehydrogenase subunit 5 [Bdellocephala punctata]